MKLFRLFLAILFLCHFTAHAQQISANPTAVSSACKADGRIDIKINNTPANIYYAIEKTPADSKGIQTNRTGNFTGLESGDYYYGYVIGTTFVKGGTITVNKNSLSGTYDRRVVAPKCSSDGYVSGVISEGKAPYKVILCSYQGGEELEEITTTTNTYKFNALAGDYVVKVVDGCGAVGSPSGFVRVFTPLIDDRNATYSINHELVLTFNTLGDCNSGIATAAFVPKFYFSGIPFLSSSIYKLEIQKEKDGPWDTYDNLSSVKDVSYALPSDPLKWGKYRVTLTICENPRTFESNIFDPLQFKPATTPTGASQQEFCKTNYKNPKVSDLVTTETGVTWYDAETGGNELPPGGLLSNGKIYYGLIKGSYSLWTQVGLGGLVLTNVGTCSYGKRLAVTAVINELQMPIGDAIQTFCKNDNKKVSDLVTDQTAVTWYNAATDGTVIAPTTVLTNGTVYYGSPLKVGTCESPTRLEVTAVINDPQTPTGTAIQTFCKNDNKKVADLVTNQTDVTWYTAATGGSIIAPTTALTNGTTYYGAGKIDTCESPTRLAVTVTVNDPQTPTGATAQEFCKVDNKKVSDLVTTESNVTWYDAATAGNVIASTSVLENNKTYYGSLKVGTCESPTRFAVTVTLSDPKTPTGTSSQEFCKIDNKKVSNLVTAESNVTWYDAATAGNVIASTSVLENNKTYYGSLKVGTCESPTRFAVTVTLSDPKTPTGTASQEFCKVDSKKVSDLVTTESNVTWYDAATAGNVIASTTALINGTVYYGSLKVGTCESPTRFAVTVTLSDPKTPTGTSSQEFCKVDNKKVSDLVTTESNVTWYDAATAGNVIASTSVLENNKVYYGSLKTGTCESPTRFAVTVTLSDPKTPTGTASQEFCKVDNKKVADLVTTESNVTWYDAATAGNVIASTTVLENNKIYYGSLKVGTCQSPTRFAVTVTLSDPKTPTGTSSQEFCKIDNKKVSDLVTTESNVTWYDAATAGNVIASTSVLENNKIYYGSLKTGTCESPTRFAVTVTLSDPKTPTGTSSQEFCKVDNKKVSDLVTTESNVRWYDAATAGNVIASTTALTNGTVYYGSLKVGTCESPTRFAVTVTLSDPKTPTGTSSQEFCKVDNKKVSDLVTTETGVTWYDAATAGNVIASTTALTNGTVYYGSLKVGTCESPTRFAVTVTLSDPKTPTGTASQEFCKVDNKKVSNLVTAESNVTWYDAATAGNVIASTSVLENNKIYYGSLKTGTCESPTRFAVTVTLSDPKTPTGTASQEFCKVGNKKVSDLVTTESNVTWYDAATAGNVIASTTALINGTVYYGSLKVGTCESPTRFAVTVTLSDPKTPTGTSSQEFCKVDNKKVSDLVTTESNVTWYDAATAGNVIASTTALENNKVYYGSLKFGTCESPTRFVVTVTLSDPKTPTGTASQEFCKVDNKKVSDLVTTESNVTWYDAATAGNVIASTTVLENNKVYYGSLKTGTCESPTRFAVTVTLSDPKTPTGTASQEFCKVDNKKVSDLVTAESNVRWYDAATAGNVIASTTVLENNKVYYGSLKVGTCESPTRFAVTVTLSDPKTPTGTASQEFCKVDNKKVADLVTTESNVTWYDAATAGNVIASTTALTNGTVYYGSLKVGTCESPTRFAVTVTLSDPKTPTGTASQEFCKVDNKKVSDLVTAESNVTWYDAATAGNVIASTTALENNKVYYGSLKVGTCESPTRFVVTVTLSDPKTPTGTASQEFCKVDNKKVSDLLTTESNVTWYDAATGGNAIASTVILENNKVYYGSLKAGTCESPTRLAVTVTLSDPQTPTTSKTTQEFCKTDNKTVVDLAVNESDVTWYDAATDGNAVASTTTLENNKVYYGSLKEGTCESPTRLAVKVILHDPKTPTGATAQEFTKTDNKTVADLITTETVVTWYDAATGGNKVDPTTVLENNKTYYGSLKEGACESPTRLPVTVTIRDPKTPTGPGTQEFCKTSNSTVADLITTETGVTWYDAPTGGNKLDPTTVLEHNKDYYASLKEGDFESPVRFSVKVIVKDCTPEPAPNWSGNGCAFDETTYKVLSGMLNYNWFVSKEGTIVAGGQPTDDYITVLWNSVGKAIVKVDYIDVSKFDPLVSVNFPVTINSCSDIGLKKVVDNANPFIGKEVVFTITAENLGTNQAKDIAISEALPSGYVYVASEVSAGKYNPTSGIWTISVLQSKESQTLKVTAKVKEKGDYLNIVYLTASNPVDTNETNNRAEASIKVKDVIVHNSVSPNGDDLNDYLRIDGLDKYPNNTVEIFNRGGVQIFKASNYGSNSNVFRGISEGRVTIDKQRGVPTGTYFYILRYEAHGTMNEKSGYLYVKN